MSSPFNKAGKGAKVKFKKGDLISSRNTGTKWIVGSTFCREYILIDHNGASLIVSSKFVDKNFLLVTKLEQALC